MQNKLEALENSVLLAGGRIRCLRCCARSKRSGVQCGRPACKASKSQKCHMHGGRGNSAPKTEAGRLSVAVAHTKSGRYTKAAKLEGSRSSARLARLEDAMYLLEMTTAPRSRGRKSALYVPVTNVRDVRSMLIEDLLHHVGGS
jgi:hypothetical protein